MRFYRMMRCSFAKPSHGRGLSQRFMSLCLCYICFISPSVSFDIGLMGLWQKIVLTSNVRSSLLTSWTNKMLQCQILTENLKGCFQAGAMMTGTLSKLLYISLPPVHEIHLLIVNPLYGEREQPFPAQPHCMWSTLVNC